MGSILLAFLPIIAIVMIGYLFFRIGLFPENVGSGLVQFVYWLAIPAMLFLHMFQTNISENIPDVSTVILCAFNFCFYPCNDFV